MSYLKIFRAYEEAQLKDAFCERYYLDARIMSEIKNVQEQLALIVGDLGIPVSSGGPMSHYLSAVARGLIQFVCARTGRGVYRSLTAESILIHPGSVMFRESPRYIVAGEVVQTSRMYARSVSPLEKSWLGDISPALAERFDESDFRSSGKSDKQGRGRDREQKDTTWQITIGGGIFELKPWKGKKKIAVLPWREISRLAAADPQMPQNYADLRGKIIYENYEISPGETLPALLRAARFVNPGRDIAREWPRKKNFDSFGGRGALVESLGFILKLARIKKGEKTYGFLALHTDGAGRYWFKSGKGFPGALETSLASLDTLADELGGEKNPALVDSVNAAYRRLTAMMEA
jgi:hypothetical protein